jgi:nucleolar protein 6
MTKRPKGFAFLEFASADAFQRGLAYHHSLLNNRKINVEMTAGGGGSKSNVRKQKLIKKNEQLQKQRQQIHTNRISTQNLQDQQESKGIKSESIAPDIARPRKRVTGANAITI